MVEVLYVFHSCFFLIHTKYIHSHNILSFMDSGVGYPMQSFLTVRSPNFTPGLQRNTLISLSTPFNAASSRTLFSNAYPSYVVSCFASPHPDLHRCTCLASPRPD